MKFLALLIASGVMDGNGAILSLEWQKFAKREKYIGIAAYPVGWAILGGNADLGLILKASNCFHGGIGIQGPDPTSNMGLYVGPLYRPKDDRHGISTSFTASGLLFHFILAHEYAGYHSMKIGMGLGFAAIWWVPNRKDRRD